MGNEMGNRNISSVPEQERIENQISSESPSDVVGAMVDDVPMSVSSAKGEDPSDSALNEETMVKREVSALDAENSSAMEADENVPAIESEDSQVATTISNVGYLSAASASERTHAAEEDENERVDHKEAVVCAEECVEVDDDSLKTKDISFNDKERNGSKHEKTESSKLEITAMEGEDKCFNAAVGLSLLYAKQSYLESEILVDASKAENERVDHEEEVMLVEECIKVKDDSLKTKEIAFEDKECNGTEHGKTESSKLEVAATQGEDKCFNEAIGVPFLDRKQLYLESEIVIDACKTENERVDHKEAVMLAEESIKVEDDSLKSMQISYNDKGFDDKSTAQTTASAKELYVNMVESTAISSYLQSVSEAEENVNISCLPEKILPIEESDLVESVKDIEQNICSQSGNLFSMNGDATMERSSSQNEVLSRQTLISETNTEFIPSEMEQCNEETMALAVEVMVKHSSSEADTHELDRKELAGTVVEITGQATSLQCASEVLQDINVLVLHRKEGESCNNVVVVSTAIEVVEVPKCLHSTSESIQNEQKEGATNDIALEIIEEPMTLPSASEASGDADMSLLPKMEDESCGNENILSSAPKEFENLNCKQPAVEGMQNKHDNMVSTAAVMEEIYESESSHDRSLHQLHEGEDKSYSTAVVLSDGEIYQQTDKMASSCFVFVALSDSKVREYDIDNREIGFCPSIIETNDQAEHIGSELNSEGLEKKISDQDEQNTLGVEVVKTDSSADFIANTEPSLVESKQDASDDLSAPQKQDVAETALHYTTKEDTNQENTVDRSIENVALPIADEDLPMWPSDSIEGAADRQADPAQHITGRNLVLTGDTPDKQQTSSSLDNEVQLSEYGSCPKLESWNEQGEDDLNTPLLPTAKGSNEEKEEAVARVNSLSDDPKISLERTESGKSRTPLRNLFAEDSVSVSGGILKSVEQRGSHEKAVQDVWGSPARLVASPTSREKQKPRSIFSQCICCTAIH